MLRKIKQYSNDMLMAALGISLDECDYKAQQVLTGILDTREADRAAKEAESK